MLQRQGTMEKRVTGMKVAMNWRKKEGRGGDRREWGVRGGEKEADRASSEAQCSQDAADRGSFLGTIFPLLGAWTLRKIQWGSPV